MKNNDEIQFKLKFLGASRTVTGSSYHLEIVEKGERLITLVVDHGMFQGPDVEARNYLPYTIKPEEVDMLLLTHAHTDHSALIPKLVKHGFKGNILATKQTLDLTELILNDSAKIQGRNHEELGTPLLYDYENVEEALSKMVEIDFEQAFAIALSDIRPELKNKDTLSKEIIVEYFRAGHILGAASIRVEYAGKSIMFSGDIGRSSQDIVKPANLEPKNADFLIMESLYGGKYHDPKAELLDNFSQHLKTHLETQGNVIVPVFSIQRAQEIILILNQLIRAGKLSKDQNIYFDSPMAARATQIYIENSKEVYAKSIEPFRSLRDGIFTKNLKVARNASMTKKAKKGKGGIIVSGGGMCNGGRVMNYLKSMLPESSTMIAMVGFQAEETLGRKLVEGAREVDIDGQTYQVNAQIQDFKGFSAHADQADLLNWLKTFDKEKLGKVFLVHAEPEQSTAFNEVISGMGYKTEIPAIDSEYLL